MLENFMKIYSPWVVDLVICVWACGCASSMNPIIDLLTLSGESPLGESIRISLFILEVLLA